MITENCISYLWSEEIIVIGSNLRYFQHCMENISVLKKCDVLFNNEHSISI